jgi:hypothetical protein
MLIFSLKCLYSVLNADIQSKGDAIQSKDADIQSKDADIQSKNTIG